jgi:processing peptidase subunit alpha
MGYTFDALKTYAPEMIELLIDCVRNPVFLDWEVNDEVIILDLAFFSHSDLVKM